MSMEREQYWGAHEQYWGVLYISSPIDRVMLNSNAFPVILIANNRAVAAQSELL